MNARSRLQFRAASRPHASHTHTSPLRCRVRVLVATLTGRVRRAPAADSADDPVGGMAGRVGTARLAEMFRAASAEPLAPFVRTQRAALATVLAAYHAGNARAARAAIDGLVRAGYHLGPVPYGYRVTRVRIPAGAGTRTATARLRRRLVVDPRTGPVVTVIFGWRVDERLGYTAIAERLAADPDRYPPPVHPRTGLPRPWSDRVVARVLCDTRYTGRQVWARTRGGRRVSPAMWVTSGPFVHEPLVDPVTFALAQSVRPRGGRAAPRHDPRPGRPRSPRRP